MKEGINELMDVRNIIWDDIDFSSMIEWMNEWMNEWMYE